MRAGVARVLVLVGLMAAGFTGYGYFSGTGGDAGACRADAPARSFDVSAISVRIVYNKWGDHDPEGMMYVLDQNEQPIREQIAAQPLTPVDLVQPLILRANAGDCLEIRFTNKLPFPVGMTPQGLAYDVNVSDGAAFGQNADTTAAPGSRRVYRWQTPDREGIHLFSDLGNPLPSEAGSNVHGLFGALIVEPGGATWTDPISGAEILSGTVADIHLPDAPDFREVVTVFHDEPEIRDHNGSHPIDPITGTEQSTFPINYRAEPDRNRINFLRQNPGSCPGCDGEEVSLSSWPFGDPDAGLIPRAYTGDPTKFRVIMAGVKETHVFHLHTHQWRQQPDDPLSPIVDSIQVGPQTSFTLDLLHGAGSLPGSFGDSIFHCHLYPHFGAGMWGLFRVLDRAEDGTRFYPDGTPAPRLMPLPDRTPPPAPTPEAPGFPHFVPGTVGHKAPQPPLFALFSPRGPTPQELATSKNPYPRAGAFFTEPCPRGAPIREFDVVAIQLPIVYNNQGWHDPEGRILVLAKDEADVLSGRKRPEPLFIRANAGDCINVNFTNKLPLFIGGNAFQPIMVTDQSGLHIHLVKFDVLGSDGTANGWNYDQSSQQPAPGQYQTVRYTWYADVELQTAFFHDHFFPAVHQSHGYFAALVIEPEGSVFLDPRTHKEIESGTQAVVSTPGEPDFREFGLAVQDFVFLFDRDGRPLNPPPVPGEPADPGVMAVNYRNEPLQFRTEPDTAYTFSSYVHGDPVTPIFEAIRGDPNRLRLIQGSQEESHSLNINGARWRKEPFDPLSPLVSAQTIGLSEAFSLFFELGEIDGRTRDYLYWFGGMDDLWLGLWGLIRVHHGQPSDLRPLPDRGRLPVPLLAVAPPDATGPPSKMGRDLPPRAANPGNPCPGWAPRRSYDVVAFQQPLQYNGAHDTDPYGLIFALAEEEAAIRAGKNPEPLVLRANHGDCVEVRLTNKLTASLPDHKHPKVPIEARFPFSQRVSLHAQLLSYDVIGSDGTAVGFNPDQTVGPGQTLIYRWYADEELGAATLWSFTDVRNQRHHGLWGGIIVEPSGATYHDPVTGAQIKTGLHAVVNVPNRGAFREFVLFGVDGIPLVDAHGVAVPDPPEADDPEDQGYKGIGYRSERFEPRLAADGRTHLVFSSSVHRDPATPLFRAYAGDAVTVRYLMPSDKPRNHTLVIHGHAWPEEPANPAGGIRANASGLSVGVVFNAPLAGGAGGEQGLPGDYAYRSGNVRSDLAQGMWGIIRVHGSPQPDLKPLTDFGF